MAHLRAVSCELGLCEAENTEINLSFNVCMNIL